MAGPSASPLSSPPSSMQRLMSSSRPEVGKRRRYDRRRPRSLSSCSWCRTLSHRDLSQVWLVRGLSQKYVELLKEALPSASRFAVISTPPNPVPENRRELEAAAKVLGMSVSFLPIQGPEDFEAVLIRAKREGATGIVATADPVTFLHRRTLVGLALQHRLAGIYWPSEFVEDGGLMY